MEQINKTNQFGFMSKARCNALELKKEPRLMQDMPSEKPKSALHLTRLNDYNETICVFCASMAGSP